ncbi:hypothetical protein E0485_15065 [Paenibacillus albiflavus]|uniref:Uncharacterized protein n=1 Tax=Paenibacillus albiflavus TaxID=2545760 RepID=A0A4R4E8N2_9BACL|nr:hypothetical protein [Paenibacillus albiflavus]TCZ76156.1 hypothetical protein E0485_15065 [Paenibacillus albiflavus]
MVDLIEQAVEKFEQIYSVSVNAIYSENGRIYPNELYLKLRSEGRRDELNRLYCIANCNTALKYDGEELDSANKQLQELLRNPKRKNNETIDYLSKTLIPLYQERIDDYTKLKKIKILQWSGMATEEIKTDYATGQIDMFDIAP